MLTEQSHERSGDRQSSGEKDLRLAMAAHELRTPLEAVFGWARLLGSGRLTLEQTRQGIDAIERNARVLGRLIDDLLDLSRPGSDGVGLIEAGVDLVALIQGALDAVQPAAEAKGVQVTFRCEAAANPVAGDTTRLQQVVVNLLSNGLKFTPPGGRVEVTLRQTASQAEIEVMDTGRGIDSTFLPHIFDPFSRADVPPGVQPGGLGLGLFIVRELVELHGGNVRAESHGPGRGARFIVRLPLVEEHEEGSDGWSEGAAKRAGDAA